MPVDMQLNMPFTMEFMSCKRNDNVDWGIVCRPPQSALSARLSSRRIMINFDVKGTFYFKYILAQNTLQGGKSKKLGPSIVNCNICIT